MTPEEAKLQLDASTLRPQDASAEARAFVEQDAELGAWVANRTEFDERVADAFGDAFAVPGDLHEKLLRMAGKTAPPKRKVMPTVVKWLAAAAVFLFITANWWWKASTADGWESEALANAKLVQYGMLRLEHRSPKLEELKQTLAAAGSLSPERLPQTLAALKTYGCRVVQIAGKPATIVCFEMEPGVEAHLVVMNAADLTGAPPQNQPQFAEQGGWSTAAWSDGKRSYLLATNGSGAKLKKLLAV